MTVWYQDKEADVEKYFVQQCNKLGWKAEKFTSTSRRSVPDRIVSKNNGDLFFCELKAPGKKPTEKQAADHKDRLSRGFRVYIADSREVCDMVIEREKWL